MISTTFKCSLESFGGVVCVCAGEREREHMWQNVKLNPGQWGCTGVSFFLQLFSKLKKICKFLFYFFIFLFFVAVLSLRFCVRAFLVVASRGHSSSRCAGLSLSRPLLLQSTGSRRACSVVVAHGPSCSAACEIVPDQGSNPCLLH